MSGSSATTTPKGTRKYQCQGPEAWAEVFRAAAAGAREGEGIRKALAYAVARREDFLGWAGRESVDTLGQSQSLVLAGVLGAQDKDESEYGRFVADVKAAADLLLV